MKRNRTSTWSLKPRTYENNFSNCPAAREPNELFVYDQEWSTGSRLSQLHSQIERCPREAAEEIPFPSAADGHSPKFSRNDDRSRITTIHDRLGIGGIYVFRLGPIIDGGPTVALTNSPV